MTAELEAEIDRLIHDAEHAESGAEFARMMVRTNPANPTHARMVTELSEKAKLLRRQAEALKPKQ